MSSYGVTTTERYQGGRTRTSESVNESVNAEVSVLLLSWPNPEVALLKLMGVGSLGNM